MTNYFNGGINLTVNGESVFLSRDIIKELHRQENVQWGKNILENYEEQLSKKWDAITDADFESIATQLEDKMMNNNGELEYEICEKVIGFIS